VLVKLASTWEGLKRPSNCKRRGSAANLTLLFSLPQAVRAAEAKVQLISPFVVGFTTVYKKENKRDYTGPEDPILVQSVQKFIRITRSSIFQLK